MSTKKFLPVDGGLPNKREIGYALQGCAIGLLIAVLILNPHDIGRVVEFLCIGFVVIGGNLIRSASKK